MDPLDISELSRELSEYVLSSSLPECVVITRGRYTSKYVQISKGDIVVLKSYTARHVTLTYREKERGIRKVCDISSDCPYKFVVLPPKESTSARAASIITYPAISDLIIDSPTYFEATSSYNDPNFHGSSIKRGDRFRFKGIMVSPEDGHKRLKVEREGKILFLNLDCKGNFYPLEDDNHYTLKELINLAPVPRRLKLVRHYEIQKNSNEQSVVSSSNYDKKNPLEKPDPLKSSSEKNMSVPYHLPFTCHGAMHMLKPDISVTISPLNDPDTLWNIPLSANIQVRMYCPDEYEVPASLFFKQSKVVPSHTPEVEEIPKFPAPSTPSLIQPLVPINVSKFYDIYSNSFPVKAQIMDVSKCNSYYENILCDHKEITIHKLQNTSKVYAKDEKTNLIYSFSKDAKVSFIEYPQKFNSVSELVTLAVGTQVVILEDIASDFPKHFSLQFGDIIRISSNNPTIMKVKHTNLECKVLKCHRINRHGGSVVKLKLPIDFDIQMVISIDHNDQQVLAVEDLISGEIPPPNRTVAVVIDNKENTDLKDLPPDLNILQILPEWLLLASLPKVNSFSDKKNKTLGISVNSGLVLAFRQRLDSSEIDRVINVRDAVQQPLEILTSTQYEERKEFCQKWGDDEEQEIESVSSNSNNDKNSAAEGSLDRTDAIERSENKEKKKTKDKVRRFSRALNPKHWRMSKAAPDPLPHPQALGLMALAVRPHYEKPNDYQEKVNSCSSLDQTLSSFGAESDEEDEKNIYEDVDIEPVRDDSKLPNQAPKSKPFSGPMHKSMPMPRIASRSQATRRKEKMSLASGHPINGEKADKPKARESAKESMSTVIVSEKSKGNDKTEYYDDDHIYEYPDGSFAKSKPLKWINRESQSQDSHGKDVKDISLPEQLPKTNSSHLSLSTLPATECGKVEKDTVKMNVSEKRNDEKNYIEYDGISTKVFSEVKSPAAQERKASIEPPVPPRRTKKNEVSKNRLSKEGMLRQSTELSDNRKSDETCSIEDMNKENSSREEKPQTKDVESINESVRAPVPKPRGLKKRAYINPENNYIENSLLLETEEKSVESYSKQDCVTDVDKKPQNKPSVATHQTVRNKIKPKPPPKPRLKAL